MESASLLVSSRQRPAAEADTTTHQSHVTENGHLDVLDLEQRIERALLRELPRISRLAAYDYKANIPCTANIDTVTHWGSHFTS